MKLQILTTSLLFLPTFLSSPIPQMGAVGATTDATSLNTLSTETMELSAITKTLIGPGTARMLDANAPVLFSEIAAIVQQENAINTAGNTVTTVTGPLSGDDASAVATALTNFMQATTDYLTTFNSLSHAFSGSNFKYPAINALRSYRIATGNLLAAELAKLDSTTSAPFAKPVKALEKLFYKAEEMIATSRN